MNTTHREQTMSTPDRPRLSLDHLDAVVFDLDGVITDTASLHEQAWTETFRVVFERLASMGTATRRDFSHEDYRRLVDGRPRLEGVRSVLADRRLDLEDGSPEDTPGAGSAWAIASAKDARFLELFRSVGPRPFPSSVALLRRIRESGVRTALVTASRHAEEVLAASRASDLFDVVVDAKATAAMQLAGKPDPVTFVEALVRLGARPERSAVFEDAASGVAAGRSAGFGLVVGVDRHGDADELLAAGAHAVVADLAEVELAGHGPASDAWHLEEPESDLGREGIRETLYTLGNGYLATRGARPYVVADAATYYPGTYFAGVYDRCSGQVGDRLVEQEAIVNAPNWLALDFSIDGGGLVGEKGTTVISKGLRLHLRRGLLERRFDVFVDDKVTSVLERRLVSMAAPHLAAIELTLVAKNWSGTLELRSGIDGAVADTGTIEERLLAGRHLEALDSGEEPPELSWLAARTIQSKVTLAQAARTRVSGEEKARVFVSDGARVAHVVTVHLEEHGRLTCEKVVASYTSRDFAISEPISAARAAARRAGSFASLLEAHERAWDELWRRGAIKLSDTHVATERATNLNRFHLLQVASPHVVDRDVGLGARGLHGEGYLGHVFWDELFILPVLNLRSPETVRALLSYRSRRLEEARHAARVAGHAGAMFPWQSGSDGRDETPEVLYNPRSGRWVPDRSRYQRHVGLAVAFNYWQYWQATGDIEHLVHHGAQVIVEIARFLASVAVFDDTLARHRIKGVMGPDEFHDSYPGSDAPGVDDNAYTNVLARWNLRRAATAAAGLVDGGVAEAELRHWSELADALADGWDASTGLYEEFAGFFQLEPLLIRDVAPRRPVAADLLLGAERVHRAQVVKQADVLMLHHLLPDEVAPGSLTANLDYYEPRTAHGSSLSPGIHAALFARAGRLDDALDALHLAASIDLDDLTRTGAGGVHLAAMGSVWQALAYGFAGVRPRGDALVIAPALPAAWSTLELRLRFLGVPLRLRVEPDVIVVDTTASVTLLVDGRRIDCATGETRIRRENQGAPS